MSLQQPGHGRCAHRNTGVVILPTFPTDVFTTTTLPLGTTTTYPILASTTTSVGATTTTAPPITHFIRIYDYTNLYAPRVQFGANYYASKLSPYGVGVSYIRMPALDGNVCWSSTNPPLAGVKMCESLGPGTAGSTGMHWIEESPNRWALSSNIQFNYPDPGRFVHCNSCDHITEPDGFAGDYLVVHELGHSTGNLPHRPPTGLVTLADKPYSAMCTMGDYVPTNLTVAEIATIVSLVPTGGPGLMMTPMEEPAFTMCDLPILTGPGGD